MSESTTNSTTNPSGLGRYRVDSAFPDLDWSKADITIVSHIPCGNPMVPTVHQEYVFDDELLRLILMYFKESMGDALYIAGPTGCGKTSCILEAAGRLNWPVENVTCRTSMEFQDLVGHHSLVAAKPGEPPVMRFQFGPLAKAMARGEILVLNEVDLLDPAELSALNDVLEGRPLVIEQNGGMCIKPHPLFRVIATGNTVGAGDEKGLYIGAQTQNIAAMDRFRMVLAHYPTPETEMSILEKVAPQLKDLHQSMVDVANDIRRQFLGEDPEQSLSVTLSTRKLVQWARICVQLWGNEKPLQTALQLCLLNRCAPHERKAIETIAKLRFGGDQWGDV